MPELLDKIRAVPVEKLQEAADELRKTIIESVSRNGGHLASSCGCVELIVALHRIFDTPAEKLFFDVGHQAYAHKLLTGRDKGFEKLRRIDGVSGFTTPMESEFDPAVSGHAGCALSAALGHCAADPDSEEKVVAIIGDGAMGCGVTLEALNHASTLPGAGRLVVILNDNRMSISGNVGALSRVLNRVIAARSYNKFRNLLKKILSPMPRLKKFFSRLDEAGKSVFLPPALFFETLGLRYFGAVNGNDLNQLLPTLSRIRQIGGPVLLHVITEKGHGCHFAAADPTRYHGISGCDPDTGEISGGIRGFSAAFAEALSKSAAKHPEIVAVCPAMLEGTGLREFAANCPKRCFDTGIAEEHALTFAAGLAAAGKIPVCAFYDTFLQRALDAVYHDIALAGLPVIIAVDRSGAVADGPTHHGIYNCGFLRSLPGVTIFSPAVESEMGMALEFAVSLHSPVIIRYPKGAGVNNGKPEDFQLGKAVIRRRGDDFSPVLWSIGGEVANALQTAEILEQSNLDCTVVDARFLKPFDRRLAGELSAHRHFVIEDHSESGGLYSALCEALCGGKHGGIYPFAWSSDEIVPHGEVELLKRQKGLDASSIAGKILLLLQKK